jgi:hypothetical protein
VSQKIPFAVGYRAPLEMSPLTNVLLILEDRRAGADWAAHWCRKNVLTGMDPLIAEEVEDKISLETPC